jgi:hypothetical protein
MNYNLYKNFFKVKQQIESCLKSSKVLTGTSKKYMDIPYYAEG